MTDEVGGLPRRLFYKRAHSDKALTLADRLFSPEGHCHLWLLLDPDAQSTDELARIASEGESAGVSVILIGGSFIAHDGFDDAVRAVKAKVHIPVLLFPGSSRQISPHADGVLFMSLLSGRNPQYLIGEQVMAAPIIKRLGLPVLPMAYLLIESGRMTSAEFVSDTKPIPRDKSGLAAAHAMAAELFGMQAVYLEAGSGAEQPVPSEMIRAVVQSVSIPIIVGGGITSPSLAKEAAEAGASAIVIGTAVEQNGSSLLGRIADAIATIPNPKSKIQNPKSI
ncbi:MAG: geranylgeranylglyceryl/heptaprenylglyceryl phosphate synthase [Calditrichaeota bacterium]|nr:geranylgeranylglyceryl/heptaprenylglyceryl phosphate synthase [Calditrichota bacterium]